MNKFRTTFNGKTLCVFAKIDRDIQVHLANVDTMANRIYTTKDGYELIGTNIFKEDHPFELFEEMKNSEYRKFNGVVTFGKYELPEVIDMCNRELVF